ncbi:unnamed protein product [Rhizophagus irregularis]|nr:unnamed protein product [Rhizophagus irregularis]
MRLLILLTSINFIWGLYVFFRGKLRFFIAFCIINLVQILILIISIGSIVKNLENIEKILIEKNDKYDDDNNVTTSLNDYWPQVISYVIFMIIFELIFIITTNGIRKGKEVPFCNRLLNSCQNDKDHSYKIFDFFLFLTLYFIVLMNDVFVFIISYTPFFAAYYFLIPIKEKQHIYWFRIAVIVQLLLYIGLIIYIYFHKNLTNFFYFLNIGVVFVIAGISSCLLIIYSMLFSNKFFDEFKKIYFSDIYDDNEIQTIRMINQIKMMNQTIGIMNETTEMMNHTIQIIQIIEIESNNLIDVNDQIINLMINTKGQITKMMDTMNHITKTIEIINQTTENNTIIKVIIKRIIKMIEETIEEMNKTIKKMKETENMNKNKPIKMIMNQTIEMMEKTIEMMNHTIQIIKDNQIDDESNNQNNIP